MNGALERQRVILLRDEARFFNFGQILELRSGETGNDVKNEIYYRYKAENYVI